MTKKIKSALISVFYKEGLETIVKKLHDLGIIIYSTGGTQKFIEELQIPCIGVESLTSYPSILGGRVKTLHPAVFGGILGRRENETDVKEMIQYNIPEIDLVVVDLYPFEETLNKTNEEKLIIEKIDIGGVSLIRAAAKNYNDVLIVASPKDYNDLEKLLNEKNGETILEDRRSFAAKAFEVCAHYDVAISNYFNSANAISILNLENKTPLRYGENPHQQAAFYGDLKKVFTQLHGKEISYNNLVDIDAAIQLINEFEETTFAIIKHTNVCGIASCKTIIDCWKDALAGDPESAFGGVLICNGTIDKETAEAISEIFFEVLTAKEFTEEALSILKLKKNRILLQYTTDKNADTNNYKSLLGGTLMQNKDEGNFTEWKEVGGRETDENEKADLIFANIVCKHLKSNAIALVKNKQLIGKGCGQTSRIDALRNAIEKAKQFSFDLHNAALASDAFFPFDDCVRIAHAEGITSFIQPGGSVRDKDSIDYCVKNNLAMVITGMRHFRH
ncbi:MAG TPA: bifunctional phosphoribosylaminoimidazolecarboxamide formyltransferase/IMP cyclohydrolase [Puia sp.]|jgi:phosphoribosylaminoimidazolecarboxamide formyltransferase/IMP cyclohydrolase|nr:bifunctional phosphoribosylaminoimidazolecarboxamide formyltransferase/IMP cyclohydrolase [Puia sp.]